MGIENIPDELRAEIARGVAQAERAEFIDGEAAMERLRRDLAEA